MFSLRSTLLLFCFVGGSVSLHAGPAREAGPERSRRSQESVTGRMTVVVEDDFEAGSARTIHVLEERATGRLLRLRFAETPAARPAAGATVTVRGERLGSEFLVTESPRTADGSTEAGAVTDDRRVVVMVVDFTDSAVGCSDSAVTQSMFDATKNVDGLYREGSYGAVSMPRDTDLDGQADVFHVGIAASISDACDPFGWAASADTAATQDGVNLGLYQHRVYVLPSNTACSWSGLGNLGCYGYCRAWIGNCALNDVYAHELGHNLGLGHASTDPNNDGNPECEYCDVSDYMGYSGVDWRQANGPHRLQLGWLPPSQVQAAEPGDRTYTLESLSTDPSVAVFPTLLRIDTTDPANPYYLSFRDTAGYDSTLASTYRTRTNVHRHPGGGTANTLYLDALDDGQSFVDATEGITVTQISHDAVSVTLLVHSPGCAAQSPTVDLAPASASGTPGESRDYVLTLTNNDDGSCPSSRFDLTANVSAGWTGTVSPDNLLLLPGEQASATLSVTSPGSADDGDYPATLDVTDATEPGHDASAVVTYAVTGAAPPSPVDLSGGALRGSVRLSWAPQPGTTPSAFRLYRDGNLLAQTGDTGYHDWSAVRGRAYTYHVTAVDGVGRESSPGNPVTLQAGTPKHARTRPTRTPPGS